MLCFLSTNSHTTPFKWYMIDFGLSTLVINGYRINSPEVGPYDPFPVTTTFSNYGHDIRTLILSMKLHILRKALPSGPVLSWIEKLRENILVELDNHSIKLDLERGHFHRAYNDALLQVQSPETKPDAILKAIETVSRQQAAATRIQSQARQRSARKKIYTAASCHSYSKSSSSKKC